MDIIAGIQNKIREVIRCAVEEAKEAGKLKLDELPDFVVEVPREKQHGDFATNIAMLTAKQAKRNPREIAEIMVEYMDTDNNWIEEVNIAGPGFINFILAKEWIYQILEAVDSVDENYGEINVGAGKKVQVEFVSANPTGLLHMGNARGAALGVSIAGILEAAGYDVSREFYINDAGNQIENFGMSLEARYMQLLGHDVEMPENGYHGQDLVETMQNLIDQVGNKYGDVEPEFRREMLVEFALKEKLDSIKQILEDFGVQYDVWFSEHSLHDSGAVEEVLKELKEKDYLYEKDGALWFKSTEFGDEKDEVVVRKNGVPTYFAADIAYHKNKFERGFQWAINVWGADHHGHVSRMKGAIEALGYDRDQLDVVIMQLVRLFKNGEILKMSKRTGQFVTLSELIEEVGRDAARFFFIMRAADSHLDFDLDLAKSQSDDNPVYYVQYAHARICSILRQASGKNIKIQRAFEVDLTCLNSEAEMNLIRKIGELPGIIRSAADSLEPHRLTHYLLDLAGLFHSFYVECRVLTDDSLKQAARLVLVNCTRIAIRNTLEIIGVDAPERM